MNHTQLQSPMLDNQQAAEYIHLSPKSLSNARSTGVLCSVAAPPYIKLGRSVRYERAALDVWLSQFKSQRNTAEDAA